MADRMGRSPFHPAGDVGATTPSRNGPWNERVFHSGAPLPLCAFLGRLPSLSKNHACVLEPSFNAIGKIKDWWRKKRPERDVCPDTVPTATREISESERRVLVPNIWAHLVHLRGTNSSPIRLSRTAFLSVSWDGVRLDDVSSPWLSARQNQDRRRTLKTTRVNWKQISTGD